MLKSYLYNVWFQHTFFEGETMRKILNIYDNFEEKVLVISLLANVILIFSQIIMRSFFGSALSWSEELSRYIFIWQIWLGTSIAFRMNAHIKVDLIYSLFKSEMAHRIIKIIVDVIWLAFNIFLLYEGIKLVESMHMRHVLSAGMRLPLVYVYAVLPISAFLMVVRMILDMICTFLELKEEVV